MSRFLAALAMAVLLLGGLSLAACSDDTTVPYTDAQSVGLIALYDAGGKAVTGGKLTDKPFVSRAVSQAKAPAPYDKEGRKASLLAFAPREKTDPAQWGGTFLTGARTYPDPTRPTVEIPADALSLAEFLTQYPATWDGLVQLRILFGVPGVSTLDNSYVTADLKVKHGRWTLLRGASAAAVRGGGIALAARGRGVLAPPSQGIAVSVEVGGTASAGGTPTGTGGNGGPLPKTGTDVMTLAGAGLVLVGVGAGALVLGRRRRSGGGRR